MDEPFRPLVVSPGEGVPYLAVPNVRSARFLLMRGRKSMAVGVRVCAPQSWKGRLQRNLLAIGIPIGERIYLAASPLHDLVNAAVGDGDFAVAFSLGTPGAYQKATAVIWSCHDNKVAAFVKIALTPLATSAIANEYRMLSMLAETPSVCGQIPKVMGRSAWMGHAILMLEPLDGVPGPRAFGPLHLEWLRMLAKQTRVVRPWDEGAFGQGLLRETQAVADALPDWRARFDTACGVIEARLRGREIPFHLAQRDFAPWNTCVKDGQLYVFDWEMGRSEYPPLYDFFHFHVIQAALLGGAPPSPQAARSLLDDVWPDAGDVMDALYLAYLLDQCLYYLNARLAVPARGNDQVSAWIGQEIERCVRECRSRSAS